MQKLGIRVRHVARIQKDVSHVSIPNEAIYEAHRVHAFHHRYRIPLISH
jgi:hypothetical protein